MKVRRTVRMGFELLIAVAIAVGLATTARAAMMYTLESGSVSLTVDEYSPGDGRLHRAANTVTVDLDSAVVMIDPDQDSMLSIVLSTSPYAQLALLPDTPASAEGGFTMLVLESLTVEALGGTLLANDSGYAFNGNVSVDAMFGVSGTGGDHQGMAGAPLMGDLGQGPIYGDLANGGMIRMSGVAVASFDSPFNGNRLVVTGDFNFVASTAPVPEPGSPLLFAAGLLVASLAVQRHSKARGGKTVAAEAP